MGAWVATTMLPVEVVAMAFAEADPTLRRFCLQHSQASDWGDIRSVTGTTVREFFEELAPEVDLVFLVAGFPCKDTTSYARAA